ncbi:M24 family metallopeptidase [Polycladidibacter stylochi]|uniref:M24 family metallopeptidase n=1 Tax=Polycladidibacter stylochi TaxID=1807766 RepID=UPI00082BEAD2|nr:M24 family metallopeptidase [Pseudovibrio stylochi]
MYYEVNGTMRNVPFSQGEYDARLACAKRVMRENDLEVLFLTSPEALYYFSGYKLGWYRVNSKKQWNYYVPASIAIHVDHEEFAFMDVAGEEEDVREDTVTKDIRIFTHAARPTYGISGNAGTIPHGGTLMRAIAKNLKETGWLTSKVGIESDKHGNHITKLVSNAFGEYGVKTTNASDLFDEIRKVKSKEELDYIVRSAEIADVSMQAIKEYLKPGVTENELLGYATYKMALAGGEPAGCSFIHGGQRVLRGHNYPSHEKLERGDVVVADLFASHQRYSSDLSRVFTVGDVDYSRYSEEKSAFVKMAEKYHPIIREKVESILKTNMLINEFTGQLKEFYQELGIWGQQFWLGGYDMGILWPGDCCGGSMVYDADMDKGDQRFVPGTAVNFETGFWVIDTLVFYEDRAIIASKTPWDIVKCSH